MVNIVKKGTNIDFTIETPIATEAYIDQSIAHDGVCLTVVSIDIETCRYVVTAIKETLDRSRLGSWQVGSIINLERSMTAGKRLDGHFVQGHVDVTTTCTGVEDVEGSWYFTFELPASGRELVVDKGSIAINGVSLTVVSPSSEHFSVAIIPYTYEHTGFKTIQPGDTINLEFDILGKYVQRMMAARGL